MNKCKYSPVDHHDLWCRNTDSLCKKNGIITLYFKVADTLLAHAAKVSASQQCLLQ